MQKTEKTLVYTMTPELAKALMEWRRALKKWDKYLDVEECDALEDRERELLQAFDAQVVTTRKRKDKR